MIDRNPVFIKAAGRVLALGAEIGGPAAPCNVAQRAIASAIEGALTHAADVQRSDAGPLAKAERTAQALAPAVKVLNDHAKTIMNVRQQLAARMGAPVVEPWSASTPYYEINTDTLLAQRFASMNPAQRAMALASIREDGAEHSDMMRALLRTPRALTGLTKAEAEGLKTTAIRTMRPDDYAMLQAEAEQLAIAEKAVVLAGEILANAGLSRAVLSEHAPATVEVAKARPLSFADEFPEPPRHAVLGAEG